MLQRQAATLEWSIVEGWRARARACWRWGGASAPPSTKVVPDAPTANHVGTRIHTLPASTRLTSTTTLLSRFLLSLVSLLTRVGLGVETSISERFLHIHLHTTSARVIARPNASPT